MACPRRRVLSLAAGAVALVALPVALAALDEAGLRVASATVSRPSLDDVYLRHTGHTFARAQQGFAPDSSEEAAS